MIDPYHHDLLPSRGAVSRAVRFALGHGWYPERKAAPLRLSFAGHQRGFVIATPGTEQPCWRPRPTRHARLGRGALVACQLTGAPRLRHNLRPKVFRSFVMISPRRAAAAENK